MSNTIKIIIVAVLALAIVLVAILKQTTSPNEATQPGVRNQATANNDEKSPGAPPDATEQKQLPALIDLGAGKCIPCKLMAPILEELKNEYAGSMKVEVIDVEKNKEMIRKYNIRVIPTQTFYDSSGRELFRHEGFYSKGDILRKWKDIGIELK